MVACIVTVAAIEVLIEASIEAEAGFMAEVHRLAEMVTEVITGLRIEVGIEVRVAECMAVEASITIPMATGVRKRPTGVRKRPLGAALAAAAALALAAVAAAET